MNLANVLIAPVVTEKSNQAQTLHKYTFRVNADSTKIDVAKAVTKAYGVDVKSVRVMPIQKKIRRVGRSKFITKRPASRRAIVTIKAKQTIDFNKLKTHK